MPTSGNLVVLLADVNFFLILDCCCEGFVLEAFMVIFHDREGHYVQLPLFPTCNGNAEMPCMSKDNWIQR